MQSKQPSPEQFAAFARQLEERGLTLESDLRSGSFGDQTLRFTASWGEIRCDRDRGVGTLAAGSSGWSTLSPIPYWIALADDRQVADEDFDWTAQTEFLLTRMTEISTRLDREPIQVSTVRDALERIRLDLAVREDPELGEWLERRAAVDKRPEEHS